MVLDPSVSGNLFIEIALDIGASTNIFLEETESRATSKNRAFLEAVKNTNRL